MKRYLIINADDCNLTRGVTQAILDCYDDGVVTSTSFMVNYPVDSSVVRALRKRKKLGIGLHLNITKGKPVSEKKRVSSLISPDDRVFSPSLKGICLKEVKMEYENQILAFQKYFGCLPTHLDTHHQIHDRWPVFQILAAVAKKYRLPMRRSALWVSEKAKKFMQQVPTTDFLFGNLDPRMGWRETSLMAVLNHLPSGTSEMVCHPGYCDSELRSLSSFTSGREAEGRLFRSLKVKTALKNSGIIRGHFGCLRS